MSAVLPKPKASQQVTASISKYVSTYVDIEVDVELEDIAEEDMAEYLREKGWTVAGAGQQLDISSYEYRLWVAMRQNRHDEVRRLLADMLYERIGRIL